eukprot:XP_001704108.1 Hypothetical protein GL50803_37065 [Giardia lamblia ATCC 50803]
MRKSRHCRVGFVLVAVQLCPLLEGLIHRCLESRKFFSILFVCVF